MKIKLILIILLAAALLTGCSHQPRLTQFSTINALMVGGYDGNFECSQLKSAGDFGIGTFDKLDGEMVLLEDTVYKIKSDGQIDRPLDSETTPFASVTFFRPNRKLESNGISTFAQLKTQVDNAIPSANIFYAIRIDGEFESVRTRSVPPQQKPYPLLTDVVKTQPTFEKRNIKGTLVGLRSPGYASGINVSGYHFHFISSDRAFGGHLLDCSVKDPRIRIEFIHDLNLVLPKQQQFYNALLDKTDQAAINKVEK